MINYWRSKPTLRSTCSLLHSRQAATAAALRYLMKDGRVPFSAPQQQQQAAHTRLPSTPLAHCRIRSSSSFTWQNNQSINLLKVDQRRESRQSHTSVT